jgi:hypothetical protein
VGLGERGVRNYTVIEAHYGPNNSFWRVVVSEKDKKFETVGKFPTKTQAEQYIAYLTQATNRRHNQW